MSAAMGMPLSFRLLNRCRVMLNSPRDIAALAVFRILLGTLMSGRALRFMSNGWIERMDVEPDFHFK